MGAKVFIAGVDTTKLPKVKNEDLVELMKKVKQGDAQARDQFVVANLRLVLSVIHRFGGYGEKADDMFQVGCLGLLKAIDNFDESLNIRFSTYAVPMIIGEIRRYLRDSNSVRVSRSLRDVAYKALQAKEELTKNNCSSTEPTIDEIAKKIEVPTKTVTFALDAISETLSLNDPIYSDGTDTIALMDQIADTKNNDEALQEKITLQDAIKTLSGREKQILLMRYYIGKTQVEVSEEIGISQAQVSRLEKNALQAIEEYLK